MSCSDLASIRIALAVAAFAVPGCDLPTSEEPHVNLERSEYVLQLLPGPFEEALSALPIRVEAWAPAEKLQEDGSHCVRVIASPGAITFPFAETEDAGVADAAAAESAEYPIQLSKPTRGSLAKAHALARYVPIKRDDVATIFAELVEGENCMGEVLASTAIVFPLERYEDASPSDGGADASNDAGEDAGADADIPEPDPDNNGGDIPTPSDEDGGL